MPDRANPDARRPLIVGVIGGQEEAGDPLALAYEVGREIGARGHILLCGGRGGVMREACRGAKDAGGTTLAILPGDDLSDANEFVDIPVITGIGFARNTIIARTAHALIAIDGAYGTLSEIAFGLIAGTPVVGLRTWQMQDPRGEAVPVVHVDSARDAVDTAVAVARVHPQQLPEVERAERETREEGGG
jgi:uncharacterized protein (TIGR00725 family)